MLIGLIGHIDVVAVKRIMGFGYTLNTIREYGNRLDPLSVYTDVKFVKRYRLSKEVVRLLIKNYVATRRRKVLRGKHAVSHRLRVSILAILIHTLICIIQPPSYSSLRSHTCQSLLTIVPHPPAGATPPFSLFSVNFYVCCVLSCLRIIFISSSVLH